MSHYLITGGASGIGAAVCARLAAAGHRVSVLDRAASTDSQAWSQIPAELRGDWHSVDVTDAEAVEAAVADLGEPLDGLVACAGIATRATVLETTPEEFDRTLDINLRGTFTTLRAVALQLVAAGRPGSIVTLASTAGVGYVSGLGIGYHASKSAVVGLTKSAAGDLAPYGIRVNSVAPGVVRTPMTVGQRDSIGEQPLAARSPAGRLAEADEIAAAIVWLLSPRASLTTGHVLPVEGGQTAISGAPGGGFPTPIADTRAIDHPRPDIAADAAYEEVR